MKFIYLQKFIEDQASMDPLHQYSAQSMVTPAHHKLKGARESKGTPPVRISFQRTAPVQPLKETYQRNCINLTHTEGVFKKADFQLAVKRVQKRSNRYYKGQQMGMCTDGQQFKVFGPGVSLFFQFQKSLINALLMMSILAIVPLVYNVCTGPVMGDKGSSLSYWIAATTIGNFDSSNSKYNQTDKLMNVIPDIISTLVFIIFYFYWLHKGEVITEEIRTQVRLRSYYAVELTDFPTDATVQDVHSFMSQFGTVMEVAPVRNYNQTIALSKKIYDLEINRKQLELKKNSDNTTEYDEEIKELQQKIDQVYKQLVLYEDDTKEDIIQYFVMFSTIQERQNALAQLAEHQKAFFDCCSPVTPENFKLCGEKVVVKACHNQPGDIIWENQHITWSTRWLRVVIQYILLIIGLAGGFLLISFLNILVPSSSSSVDTSSYTSTTILSETNTTIVQSWCIANNAQVLQAGSSSAIYTYCWDYIFKYYLQIAVTIGIAIAIVLIKFILKHFVIYLSTFKRYKTHTQQSKDMIQNLFFVYVSTTVLVTLLLQAQVLTISFKQLITYFISSDYLTTNTNSLVQYSDFVSDWYVQIGYQIIFNALILVFHPTFTMPIFYCLMEKISRCRAQKQEVQAKMEKIMEPPEFELESDYAQILTLIFMCLSFSGGMPLITILCFLAVLMRYFYEKFYFFRYCRIPKMMDEALDLKVTSLLPYAILIHFCFSIWMFGANTIFSYDSTNFTDSISNSENSFVKSVVFILQRLLGTWYYSIFFGVFLLVWFFKQLLYNFLVKTFFRAGQTTKVVPIKVENKGQSGTGTGFGNFVSSKTLCDSYKIENNPDYEEVLEIMKRKRKFIVRVKNVSPELAS